MAVDIQNKIEHIYIFYPGGISQIKLFGTEFYNASRLKQMQKHLKVALQDLFLHT